MLNDGIECDDIEAFRRKIGLFQHSTDGAQAETLSGDLKGPLIHIQHGAFEPHFLEKAGSMSAPPSHIQQLSLAQPCDL